MKKFSLFLCFALIALTQVLNAAQPLIPLIVNSGTAPVIDGVGDDAVWTNLPWNNIDVIFKGEASGFGDHGSTPAADLTAKFKVTFDDSKIYFFFDVTDDIITQDEDPGAHWKGDKVEIYFGLPGYTPTAQANGTHARQFAIRAQFDPTIWGQDGSDNYSPASDNLATNGVTYSYIEGNTGYTLEVSIDRAIALESVPNGSTVAFDVDICDNDELNMAGARYRKSWYNDGLINELWADMSGAGQMTLNSLAALNTLKQNVNYSVLNNILTVMTSENSTLRVYDVTGKSLIESKNSNKIDIATLKSGIYIVNVKSVQGETVGNFRFFK